MRMPPSLRPARAKDSIQNRRARGELSCAECRRHKLKCDKAIPCGTCVRKGCESICPNGTLSPVHGSRPSGLDASAHDTRVVELTKRIRQLEDALQISHSTVSSETHPLLTEELLHVKNGSVLPTVSKDENELVDTDLVDSLGTLAITSKGSEIYYGGPGQDVIIVSPFISIREDPANQEKHHIDTPEFLEESDPSSSPPYPTSYLSKAFPFTPLYLPVPEIQASIEERLPSYARASALVEAYLENLSWYFRPVHREQIMEELLPIVYKGRQPEFIAVKGSSASRNTRSDAPPPTDPHVLALLLAIFAAGATADLTLPQWNDEADLYYHLARAALSLKPVLEGAGLHAVQAVALIGAYDLFSCRKKDFEGTWKIISLSLSLAASIGLNRDPAHFNLPPKLVQRRRRLFWELYSLDIWKSIGTGRPLSFTPSVLDCRFPEDIDAVPGENETQRSDSIWHMRYRYIRDIMMELVSKLGSIRPVKYSEILVLDNKIREYNPQGIVSSPISGHTSTSDGSNNSVQTGIRQAQMGLLKDITLLLLHRTFFMRAMVEDPMNPTRTQFGPSFLSVYRSAVSLVRIVVERFEKNKHLLLRCWPIWGHTLHATVMLGSIAICGTSSALAPQAFVHFSVALEMFSKVQMNPVVRHKIPLLMKLREKAAQALAKHGNEMPIQPPPFSFPISKNQDFDYPTGLEGALQRSRGGEFEATPSRIRDKGYGSRQPETEPVMTRRVEALPSSLFIHMKGPRPMHIEGSPSMGNTLVQAADFGAHVEQGKGSGQRPIPKGEFAPPLAAGQTGRTSTFVHHSPEQQHERCMTIRLDGSETDASDSQSDMQVDQMPCSSNYDSQPFEMPVFSSTGNPDAVNTVMNHSGSPINSRGPYSSFIAADQVQSKPGSIEQQSFIYPHAYGAPSRLSPESFFNPDFDVSFDMRASVGEENVLPLLPQDMEAWRAILQDSRFFGFFNEAPESEVGTPGSV